jgi:hypothetical protein
MSRIIGLYSTYRVPGNKMSRIRHLHVNARAARDHPETEIEEQIIPQNALKHNRPESSQGPGPFAFETGCA